MTRCLLVGGPYDGAGFDAPLVPECWWIRVDPEHIGPLGLLAGTQPNGGQRYVLSAVDTDRVLYQHESINTHIGLRETVA